MIRSRRGLRSPHKGKPDGASEIGHTAIRVALGLVGGVALTGLLASPALAAESAVAEQSAGSTPVLLGLSLGGVLWLLAGLVAVTGGFILATRSPAGTTSVIQAPDDAQPASRSAADEPSAPRVVEPAKRADPASGVDPSNRTPNHDHKLNGASK